MMLFVFIMANLSGLIVATIKIKKIFLLVLSFLTFHGVFWTVFFIEKRSNFLPVLFIIVFIIISNIISVVIALCFIAIQKSAPNR